MDAQFRINPWRLDSIAVVRLSDSAVVADQMFQGGYIAEQDYRTFQRKLKAAGYKSSKIVILTYGTRPDRKAFETATGIK